MWEERDVIGNIPLNNLMIPGTHNSGSYIPKGSNVSFLTTRIDVYYEISNKIFTTNQHFTFLPYFQLISGKFAKEIQFTTS